ncbi:MAG: hypothetical protein Q9159_006479, partial [Coniocarpon cinnabarinum]
GTKPNCLRCIRARKACLGYERPLIFRIACPQQTPQRRVLSPPNPSKELDLTAFGDPICFSFLLQNFVLRSYGGPWLEKAAAGNLRSRVREQLDRAFRWRWQWQHENAATAWEKREPQQQRDDLVTLLRKPLWFDSLCHATEISLYNAVLLWLLALLWRLDPEDRLDPIVESANRTRIVEVPTQEELDPLHLPGAATTLVPVAVEIVRVFAFQLQAFRSTSTFSPFLMMPISLAWRALEPIEEARDIVESMLDCSDAVHGFLSGSNLGSKGSSVPRMPLLKRQRLLQLTLI